jgi:hypothetical protein
MSIVIRLKALITKAIHRICDIKSNSLLNVFFNPAKDVLAVFMNRCGKNFAIELGPV